MIDMDLTTDEITKRLGQHGVYFSLTEFIKEIRTTRSLEEIGEMWVDESHCDPLSFHADFISLAPIVLWRRLASDVPCYEMIQEAVERGNEFIKADETHGEGLSQFQKAWDTFLSLKPTSVKEMTLTTASPFWGPHCFSEWATTFEGELLKAWERGGANAREVAYQRIKFCEEFFRLLPEDRLSGRMLREAAESYWDLGDRASAENLYRVTTIRCPDDVWNYLSWGDRYSRAEPVDFLRAEEIYLLGLRRVTERDATTLVDRLLNLYGAAEDAGCTHLLRREIDVDNMVRQNFRTVRPS